MSIRLGINGFGRIGRAIFRLIHKKFPDVKVVAINDLVSSSTLAYLLKYDSVHGRFEADVKTNENELVVDGKVTQVLQEKDPTNLPWKELQVDYVIEATGIFKKKEDITKHIDAGAKRVILSAPAKDKIPTYVMGVNHTLYDPNKDFIISNASCTTNCLAPLTKVLLDAFGIEEGLMTTIHAVTPTQPTLDSPSKKDLRGGRSAMQNIIPASTGAAKAVAQCIPEVEGKLTGMAFRVPVADVSVVDLTLRLTKSTSYDTICSTIKSSAESDLKGILEYTDEEVVSSDFIGNTHSSIFDKHAGIALNNNFFKLVAWYDNEVGYACRMIDLMRYIAAKD